MLRNNNAISADRAICRAAEEKGEFKWAMIPNGGPGSSS